MCIVLSITELVLFVVLSPLCVAATRSVKSLENVSSQCVGEDGGNGRNKHCYGKNAPHTYIQVCCCKFHARLSDLIRST